MMKFKWWLGIGILIVATGILSFLFRGNSQQQTRPLRVSSVQEIGPLQQPDSFFRDGGGSGLIGETILWTFGDTIFKKPAVDGARYRSNSAALSSPDSPQKLVEPLDPQGNPAQLIPFTKEEEEYNRASGRPDERIAVWPGSVVSMNNMNGVIFFRSLKVHPGVLNYEFLRSGVATITTDQTTAQRDPSALFISPEPLFDKGAVKKNNDLYLYGCGKKGETLTFSCFVARTPLSGLHDRSNYSFWDGTSWNADIQKAKQVLDGPSGGLTVSWNNYLHSYVAVYNEALSNKVLLKTAPSPEGPWSNPITAFTGIAPAQKGKINYAGLEHPELSTDGGKTVVMSYYHPLQGFQGEVRLVKVTFE